MARCACARTLLISFGVPSERLLWHPQHRECPGGKCSNHERDYVIPRPGSKSPVGGWENMPPFFPRWGRRTFQGSLRPCCVSYTNLPWGNGLYQAFDPKCKNYLLVVGMIVSFGNVAFTVKNTILLWYLSPLQLIQDAIFFFNTAIVISCTLQFCKGE